jgi:hypothetical protein
MSLLQALSMPVVGRFAVKSRYALLSAKKPQWPIKKSAIAMVSGVRSD